MNGNGGEPTFGIEPEAQAYENVVWGSDDNGAVGVYVHPIPEGAGIQFSYGIVVVRRDAERRLSPTDDGAGLTTGDLRRLRERIDSLLPDE